MIMSPAIWSLPNALWAKAPESTSKLCIYFLTFRGARGGQEVSFMLQSSLLDPVGAPGHGGKAYFPT